LKELSQKYDLNSWLPTSVKEMKLRGWDQVDVVLFTGDAYIDHPSFGSAIVSRWLEYLGLKVAIVPQPNWQDDLRDFKKFGKPNLFFAVTAGNMDSMINHYTANRRKRSDDAFTPGGRAGARPDYAAIVYTQILKKLFPEIPVIIGGIEASLRRLTHYDYWSDTLKPSVLIESGADLLVYGMGEMPMKAIVERLVNGESLDSLKDIPQTAFLISSKENLSESAFQRRIKLFSFQEVKKDKVKFAKNFKVIEEESNRDDAAQIIEPTDEKLVVINPPFAKYTQEEIDLPYSLPYTRMPHPRYLGKGQIPAYEMIRDSINIHRGCFGGCSFCTISAHQGKHILSRSESSVMLEAEKVVDTPGFHGNLSDLGGPSANMYQMEGKNKLICSKCRRASCIYPSVCKNLNASHKKLTELYQRVSNIQGIKNLFIGSGIRYDLFYGLNEAQQEKEAWEYFKQLVLKHVSGRLKVAPEHNAPHVLKLMRKPSFDYFYRLKSDFEAICRKADIKQQIIPYLISSHPGSTSMDMAELAVELKHCGIYPEQVQDFTPTPMTLSSAIYYSGFDPYTLKPVHTASTPEEKRNQQRFFFYYKPENQQEIRRHLIRINRTDLIKKLFKK
jgi:uncharacterized radical SAM protein YgiQ